MRSRSNVALETLASQMQGKERVRIKVGQDEIQKLRKMWSTGRSTLRKSPPRGSSALTLISPRVVDGRWEPKR